MIAPLNIEFEVAAEPAHAFRTWVERAELWWPRGHTLTGEPVAIVFEPRPGGRIYERDAQGTELPWGEIVVWSPPARIEFLWHIFFTPEEATHVEMTFTPIATPTGTGTVVRIVHTGWDALAEQGPLRREGNERGWTAVIDAYRQAVEERRTSP